MSKIFDIFGVNAPRKPFSLFTGSPRQLVSLDNPDRGYHPNPEYNSITAAYSRNPLWFSSQVVPNVQPTVDANLYWPLNYTLLNKDLRPAGAGSTKVPFGLNTGTTHSMVIYLTTSAGETGAGVSSEIWIQQGDINNGMQRVTLCEFTHDLDQIGMLINTAKRNLSAGGTADIFSGIRPVYIPAGFDLVLQFNGLSGGNNATVRAIVYTLPANQPFGPLISCI